MNEGFYIGLTLFSVFMASCSQVILKKSAMNDRLSGLSYFVNRATVSAYAIFFGCSLLTFYCLSHLPMVTVNCCKLFRITTECARKSARA